MNKYNKVFLVIKNHCKKERQFAQISNFDIVAREAEIPVTDLEEYLFRLKEMGLINYSIADRYIYLTAFGNKHDKLTSD